MDKKLIADYLLDPSSASACIDLAKALPRLARPLFRRAILLDPASANAHFGLATALGEGQDRAAVGMQLMRTIAIAPDFVGGYNNLAALFENAKQMQRALTLGYRASLIAPEMAVVQANFGAQLEKSGHGGMAAVAYMRSLALNPALANTLGDFATTLSKMGHLDHAKRWFRRAVGLAPGNLRYYGSLLDLEGDGAAGAMRASLEKAMESRETLSDDERIDGHFALGKALAESGDTAGAFAQWQDANRLICKTNAYDEAETMEQFVALKSRFTKTFLEEAPNSGLDSELPVFIVGMPRCGSSMVEQMIASHPSAAGAGEIGDLGKLGKACGVSNALYEGAQADRLKALAESYLAVLRNVGPDRARVTDKLLANFLRVGLIRLVLPGARIIHVKRSPIDSCMSIFSQRFHTPQPYAGDLGRLGRYYRAYDDLMKHWRTVISGAFLLEVRYEEIIADPRTEIGRMLDFIDLPWDDRCLEFHRTERLVHTASKVQVKRPLYTSSVGRWHPYLPYLRPLLDGLGPLAEEL